MKHAWTAVAALAWLLLPSLPAAAVEQITRIAMERSERRELDFEVENSCRGGPREFEAELSGGILQIATITAGGTGRGPGIGTSWRRFQVDASAAVKLRLRLQPRAAGRFSGSLRVRCTNCPKRCYQTGHPGPTFEHRIDATVIDLGRFRREANSFVGADRANLPVTMEGLRLTRRVEDVERAAFDLLVSSVFLIGSIDRGTLAAGYPEAEATTLLEENRAEIRRATREMIEAGMVEEGWHYVEITWRHDNGASFTTLAATDREGRVEFEPVLHLHGEEVLSTGEPPPAQARERDGAAATRRSRRTAPPTYPAVLRHPARAHASLGSAQLAPASAAPASLATGGAAGNCRDWFTNNFFGRKCIDVRWTLDARDPCGEKELPDLGGLTVTDNRRGVGCVLWREPETLVGHSCKKTANGTEIVRRWVVEIWYEVGFGGLLRIDPETRARSAHHGLLLRDWDDDPANLEGSSITEKNQGGRRPLGYWRKKLINENNSCR